jgi:hypothetical protein
MGISVEVRYGDKPWMALYKDVGKANKGICNNCLIITICLLCPSFSLGHCDFCPHLKYNRILSDEKEVS